MTRNFNTHTLKLLENHNFFKSYRKLKIIRKLKLCKIIYKWKYYNKSVNVIKNNGNFKFR